MIISESTIPSEEVISEPFEKRAENKATRATRASSVENASVEQVPIEFLQRSLLQVLMGVKLHA